MHRAGRGTTVTLAIPAGEAGAAASLTETPPPAPQPPGRRCASWWSTDDPRALRFVRDALSDAGYAPRVTGARRTCRGSSAPRGPDGAARSGAARHRRHRADAAGPRFRRPAGHLHLRLRPRRDRREGARVGRGRLHRQALFANRAGGAGPEPVPPNRAEPREGRVEEHGRRGRDGRDGREVAHVNVVHCGIRNHPARVSSRHGDPGDANLRTITFLDSAVDPGRQRVGDFAREEGEGQRLVSR